MSSVSNALIALNISDYTLEGEPTNEQEFLESFKKVTSVDEDGNAIYSSDPTDFGVTWAEIEAKQVELNEDYVATQYKRDRAKAYPDIGDQLDALFHAGVFPEEMAAQIQAVKDAHPKPTEEV